MGVLFAPKIAKKSPSPSSMDHYIVAFFYGIYCKQAHAPWLQCKVRLTGLLIVYLSFMVAFIMFVTLYGQIGTDGKIFSLVNSNEGL